MRSRLTRLAERDLEDAARRSFREFGARQGQRYAELLRDTLRLITEDPNRAGSRPASELGSSVRSLHAAIAAKRRGAARHLVFYLEQPRGDGHAAIVFLRVLHDAMSAERRVAAALREEERRR